MTATAVRDLEVIEFIDNLFEDERRWTKHVPARNALGRTTNPNDPEACSFCFTGAVSRYTSDTWQYQRILNEVEKYLPARYGGNVPAFNDSMKTSIHDVRAVLKAAATALRHR